MEKINIGISACLLGQTVRFDGGHQHDHYLTDVLGKYFEYHPLCPEVAIGLGVPRSSLRLIANAEGEPQAIMPNTGVNHTEALRQFADRAVPKLPEISGYILKKKSPSCGMERVRIYSDKGMPIANGMGIFAQRLIENCPLLPVEEEGRLFDLRLRENFIKRVYVYAEWQRLVRDGLTYHHLLQFHSRHKLLLIAHHYGNSKLLGKLIANFSPDNLSTVAQEYIALFMQTLKRLPDRRHHGQVLTRIVATINKHLKPEQQKDVSKLIEEYLAGYVSLATPVRMIRHYLTQVGEPYLELQSYLKPYPEELGLMNGV